MAEVVELEVPARSDQLALVRVVVASVARIGSALSDRQLDDLRLAVSEGCANALDAQRAQGTDQSLRIRIELLPDGIAVTITDHAGGFEPAEVPPIPAATDPTRLGHERGLGIPIMRALVDEVSFARTDDGTSVRLLVRI